LAFGWSARARRAARLTTNFATSGSSARSRRLSTITAHQGIAPSKLSVSTTVVMNSLSVTGSSAAPVGVAQPNLRAYQPSSRSDSPEAATIATRPQGSPTNTNATASGIRVRLSSPGIETTSRARYCPTA
jgi:hypothetical protein